MKILKILLLALSITFLFGCEEADKGFEFDEETFEYIGVTDDEYLLFRNSGNDNLEVIIDNDGNLTASYEKNQDIYLIMGTKEDYQIRKNGSLIQICTVTDGDATCSGSEFVHFNHEVNVLFEVFEEAGSNTLAIVLGLVGASAIILVAVVPKGFYEKLGLKNFSLGQVFWTRVVIIILLILGITLVVLSIGVG